MSAFQPFSISSRSSRLALQLGVVLVLGCWAVTVHRLGGLWSALPEYSYGWSVPMLCVILFLDRWRTRPTEMLKSGEAEILKDGQAETRKHGSTETPKYRNTGLLSAFSFQNFSVFLAALAFVLSRAALEVIPTWRFAAWTLALATISLTFMVLSRLRFRVSGFQGSSVSHFAFPVLFFLLAVPWPDRFEGPFIQALTELNAAMTVEVMAFLKVAAVRMGNIILIEPGMVGVQEACSGIRSFQSTLMVALFLGELFRFSFWRRVVFVIAGAMLSFGFNIVRTSFLVWTCNRDGLGAVDKFHDPAGWTILAASVAGLALIGWLLYRQQGRARHPVRAESGETPTADFRPPTSAPRSLVPNPQPSTFNLQLGVLCATLLATLIGTELGIRWWFGIHERPSRSAVVDFVTRFDAGGASSKPLKITREVQAMLDYDRGSGWEWQGGGAERWQAFYFVWDEPKTLAREIACNSAATGHQPELCFTRAGMQLRQMFGRRRYVANGVPLVFKVYEFADRNIPIYVFSCTWERNAQQSTSDEEQLRGGPSTAHGIRQAIHQFTRGERGITDEVRVLKFGVWGPRTIGEAEASFQQQLNLLVQPANPASPGVSGGKI